MSSEQSAQELSPSLIDALMAQIKEARKDPELRAAIDDEFDRISKVHVGIDRILSRGKLSGKKAATVDKYVDKYMQILGIEERPDVRVANIAARQDYLPPGSDGGGALGATFWHPLRPYTSVIQIDKTLFKAPTALENTIAHEVVHHRANLALTDDDIRKYLETGALPEWWSADHGHGKAFQEGAAHVNAVMGENYITKDELTAAELKELDQIDEAQRVRQRRIRVGMQIATAALGTYVLISAWKRLFPRKTSSTPLQPIGPSQPAVANERGSYGRPKSLRSTAPPRRP